ncbi:hypothetical protein P6709_19885, partial [Jeotgalibacillus sp. ET6]|nr:hypothetical protein [Jeotgalibacillus sp. ET6]
MNTILDDTLLWDKKSIEEALLLTAQQAMETYKVDAETSRGFYYMMELVQSGIGEQAAKGLKIEI